MFTLFVTRKCEDKNKIENTTVRLAKLSLSPDCYAVFVRFIGVGLLPSLYVQPATNDLILLMMHY